MADPGLSKGGRGSMYSGEGDVGAKRLRIFGHAHFFIGTTPILGCDFCSRQLWI